MLTKKQHDLLDFINRRLQRDGVPPSFDEMKDALDLKSKSGIHRLITALEERGFIRRLAHRARAIEIVKLPDSLGSAPAGFQPKVIDGDKPDAPAPRAAQDVTEAEIARARTQSKAAIVMALESPAARAERMAALMVVWGEVRPIEDTIAKIDAVDVARARGVLDKMRISQPTLALYGPVEAAAPVEELAGRLAA